MNAQEGESVVRPLPLWGALAVFPLCHIARRLNGVQGARLAVSWWPLVPALVLFAPTWNTLYPLFALVAFWLLLRGGGRTPARERYEFEPIWRRLDLPGHDDLAEPERGVGLVDPGMWRLGCVSGGHDQHAHQGAEPERSSYPECHMGKYRVASNLPVSVIGQVLPRARGRAVGPQPRHPASTQISLIR